MLHLSLSLMEKLNKPESAIFMSLFWFGCSWGSDFYRIYYVHYFHAYMFLLVNGSHISLNGSSYVPYPFWHKPIHSFFFKKRTEKNVCLWLFLIVLEWNLFANSSNYTSSIVCGLVLLYHQHCSMGDAIMQTHFEDPVLTHGYGN